MCSYHGKTNLRTNVWFKFEENTEKIMILFQEELDDIIRYGSKELFADENDEAGKSRQIHYDDAAIDR